MQPFLPARIVGGSVLVEQKPFRMGAILEFRGVEIPDRAALDPKPGLSAPRPPPRRVEVREAHAYREGEAPYLELFQDTVAELASLAGSPAPLLLHTFGNRDGRVHAMVTEQLEGLALDRIVGELHERGEHLPISVALAIAQGLVPLWRKGGLGEARGPSS